MPSDWSYACAATSTYRKVDATGWVPVNFTFVSFGAPLNTLPIDPVNTASFGNYYTYVIGGSWELNAILESSKYRNNTSIVKQNLPGVLAVGSNLSLSPIFNNSGLVDYWKFDEGSGTTAGDSSGNGNTGTLTNGPTWTSGKVGNALSFDGSDDYVNAGNGASLNIPGAVTIAAWFSLADLNNYRAIISKYNVTATQPVYALFTTANKLRWEVSDVGEGTRYLDWYLTGVLSTNTWYHIVITYDGSIFRSYINGIYYNQAAWVYGFGNNTFNLNIGKFWAGVFNGLIDDVRIYNRALSAAEIAAIYNATK